MRPEERDPAHPIVRERIPELITLVEPLVPPPPPLEE
jgi:hypothetical protein